MVEVVFAWVRRKEVVLMEAQLEKSLLRVDRYTQKLAGKLKGVFTVTQEHVSPAERLARAERFINFANRVASSLRRIANMLEEASDGTKERAARFAAANKLAFPSPTIPTALA